MDSYIVRVYRRTACNSGEEIAGLVEEVGTDQHRSFQSFSGLMTTIRQIVGNSEDEKSVVCELTQARKVVVNHK